MDGQIMISIVTPFYNQTAVFWETYQAVIHQSFRSWDWIIVDDGSTKAESLEILGQLRQQGHPSLRVLTLESNQGLPAARNAGVRAAQAELIFFLDSDDLIEPDYLEKAWITLRLNPAYSFVNSWSTGFGAKTYDWMAGLDKKHRFLEENWVAFAGLFRKPVLQDIPFNEERKEGLEDWEFWLAAAAKGYWGYSIPEKLFHYRTHIDQNKWKNWDQGAKQASIKKELQKKYAGPLKKKFPDPCKNEWHPGEGMPYLPPFPREKTKPLILVALPYLSLGGVEQFTLEWMRAMREEFDFVVVTTSFSAQNDHPDFRSLSKGVYSLHNLSGPTLYPSTLLYILESWRPDMVVLSHSEPFYHLLPFVKSCYPLLPVIDINHIEDPDWQDGGFPNIAASFSAYIDRHLVVSNWLRDYMIQKGVAQEKITTVYINTDIRKIEFTEEREAEKPVILFAGRLTQQKNVLLLPHIAEKLVKAGRDFRMVICGDGPDREALEEAIYKKRLGVYFHLMGAVSHATVLEQMKSSVILLLPSAWEGIATVLYEAMAAGLPVVATAVGGQRELVTPQTGVLIPIPASDELLAEAVATSLAALLDDPALRREMGRAGRERVAGHFDSAFTWTLMRTIFGEIISRRPIHEKWDCPDMQGKAFDFVNYTDFAQRWNILQSRGEKSWKTRRSAVLLRKVFKVATRKRPIHYLWTNGQNTGY